MPATLRTSHREAVAKDFAASQNLSINFRPALDHAKDSSRWARVLRVMPVGGSHPACAAAVRSNQSMNSLTVPMLATRV